ncbi:MAG: thioredoxin domain-containing protein [Desulfobacteraceae bacterium]|nr:thioredoxin domain-containing protein [Desulfobacteraceae bacterium]
MANRLLHEKSPYLLQHCQNPVDWYPWSDEAFETAKKLGKPVFLSVGYATCHWCHVMERESFEDEQTAAVLNDSFVCIKVDREERPDIDAVYMAACHLLTGGGGWPLNVILTPEKKPFFAATYIAKTSRFGRMGIVDLCRRVTDLVNNEPERIKESAEAITAHIADAFVFESEPEAFAEAAVLDQALSLIGKHYDPGHGGFERAPKFPMAHRLLFLLRSYRRTKDRRLLDMVNRTLTCMRLGGIWDHVGFGFHRYSTDRKWLLPHFEKMLYDQAMLVLAYLEGFRLTGNPLFKQTVDEILAYVFREMTGSQGGFYSAQDADSQGEEGKFYLWTCDEFDNLAKKLGKGVDWLQVFNLSCDGNFSDEATGRKTGTNVLYLTRAMHDWAMEQGLSPDQLSVKWEQLRQSLFAARQKRVRPLVDDKILTDWNGLMIAALARAANVLGNSGYATGARKSALFILDHMSDDTGRLLHRHRNADTALAGTANDYAFFIMGLLELHQVTKESQWLEIAVNFQKTMDTFFMDKKNGGYFLTPEDQNDLPVRPKELYDGAIPSANAAVLKNLIMLHRLTGENVWKNQTKNQIRAFAVSVKKQPSAYTHTLSGWDEVLF